MPSTGSGTLNKYQHPQQISVPSTNSGTAVYTSSTGRGTTQGKDQGCKNIEEQRPQAQETMEPNHKKGRIKITGLL
jgi:hypothetical protein